MVMMVQQNLGKRYTGKLLFNKNTLKGLHKRFGRFQHYRVEMSVSSKIMLNLLEKMSGKKPRRAEVVMLIPNKHGKIWVHTKESYPQDVYRLMSGGLDMGEVPDQALYREAREETGFNVKIERCLAAITYKFKPVKTNTSVLFTSYLFLTKPMSGAPHPMDEAEAITDFQTVSVKKLRAIAKQLRSLKGDYLDWGNFRAVAHDIAGQCLSHK